ncbi:MAG: hypothetical protein JWN43_489 [Gammaproteobacteria bacterium]|nr:hypothetical protein [Gammaproteobacteria bacterium]
MWQTAAHTVSYYEKFSDQSILHTDAPRMPRSCVAQSHRPNQRDHEQNEIGGKTKSRPRAGKP